MLSLRSTIFLFLLILSVGPLGAVLLLNLKFELPLLESIEAKYESALQKSRLSPIETRIHTYSELIRFVSQLPAVAEILDHGKTRPGSIEKKLAFARYTGVITRAFKRYPDIANVHIYNASATELLHIEKQTDQKFHQMINHIQQSENDRVSFARALNLKSNEVIVVPVVLHKQQSNATDIPRLLLRMTTPIILKNETIGVFVSDVDVGVLSRSFPGVHWVFSDGSYMSDQGRQHSALERFPELEKIFKAGKAALSGGDTRMSWHPLFAGGEKDLTLWAGQEIHLNSAQAARERVYWEILLVSAAALMGFVVAFTASRRVEVFFSKLLQSLEATILHDNFRPRVESSKFVEVRAFLSRLNSLNNAHEKLEGEKSLAQKALRSNEEILRAITEAVQSAVILIDDQGCVQFLNPAAEDLFGFNEQEIIGHRLHELIAPDHYLEQARKGLAHYASTGEGPLFNQPLDLIARHKDGHELPIELHVGRIKRGEKWWAVGAVIDISERLAKEHALQKLAETDPLTEANNRRKFFLLAEQELKRCRRYQHSFFILMMDLDHFKRVNDDFGHAVGDEVLRQFAAICKAKLRDSDLFGRVGGEEFACVISELEEDVVCVVAERIRLAFSRVVIQYADETLDIETTVSIGIAPADCSKDNVEQALKKADLALYEAKRQGRNRVVFKDNFTKDSAE